MATDSELARLLAGYGEGYRDPRLDMDSADYSTANVLQRMNAPPSPWPMRALRAAASYIPTDDRESTKRGADEPWMNWWARTNLDSGGASALAGMAKGALGTTANWLEGKPEIGPDTLAPLRLAAFGVAPTGATLAATAGRRAAHLPMDKSLRLMPWKESGADMSLSGHDKPTRLAESAARGENAFERFFARLPKSAPDLAIMRGEAPIGAMSYDTIAPKAYVHWLHSREPLSVGDWRALREDFRRLHPDITDFEGYRNSGAKVNRPDTPEGRRQAVTMRSDPTLSSLPGTVVAPPRSEDRGNPLQFAPSPALEKDIGWLLQNIQALDPGYRAGARESTHIEDRRGERPMTFPDLRHLYYQMHTPEELQRYYGIRPLQPIPFDAEGPLPEPRSPK